MAAIADGRANVKTAIASRELAKGSLAPMEPNSWDGILADLESASALDPHDPGVEELLGALKARRPDGTEYMREATVHFARSLDLRPGSPYGWVNLIELAYRMGGGGRQIEALIGRAVQLGPSEPAVQRIVADYGLAVWSEMDTKTQESIERMVAVGLRRNPLEMLQVSERRGRLDVACRHIFEVTRTIEARWSKICQSTEATP